MPPGGWTRREGYTATGQLVSTNVYLWDSNGGDTSCTVYPGQLYAVVDDEGWQKSSYDVRNRTLKTVRYLAKNGNSYTNQFAFDDADRLTQTTYPNGGPVITNSFDLGGNLAQVKQVGGGNTVFYAARGFNALRQLLGVNFGNGVVTTNNYYPASLRLQKIVTSKASTLQSLAYTFDAVGNVKSVADGVYSGSAAATFGNIAYDDLNRVTSLTNASGSFNYGFDSVGNVLTNGESGGSNYVYGTIRPHCVRSANGVAYLYDQDGNVVFRGRQRLDYDVNNHLWRVINTNGVVTTFGYDADGQRLWEQSGTNSLQVWIGNNYEEKQGQVLFHVYAGGRQVCTFDQTGTNVFQYYHPDNLGSTSIQTDTNGAVVQDYGYSAFGQSRYTQSSTVFKVSRRYTGQVLDDNTGLYYYNARYYDPLLARFTQPDDRIPDFSDPQSYNRYSYCVNNPLRYTDPSGHDFEQGLNDFMDALVAANPVVGGAEKIGVAAMEEAPKVVRAVGESAMAVVKGAAASSEELVKATEATGGAIKSTYDAYKAGEKAEAVLADKAVHRVVTPGKPEFQLRSGEQGLSVFDASKVSPGSILPTFREGSQVTTKTVKEIENLGLKVEKTPGHPDLPQHLQDAHMEIRPGPNMTTRPEFKQAIKKLEPPAQ